MQHHVEHPEMGVALLKGFCELRQRLGCPPATLRAAAAVAEISDLEDGLMEQLLLLTLPDMLVIVRDLISGLFLPGVVDLQRRVKQLVIDLLQILVDKDDVLPRPVAVYIGRCKLPVVMPDTNISTSSSYVRVDDEGNTIVSNFDAIPLADWTSDDGYMKITTNYSYIKTVGREKYYSVWARGTWQEYPAIALQDAFVLGTSGTFDDSYSEYGSVSQTFTCTSGCTQKTYKNRSVSSSNTIDEDLSFDYERFIPVMHFVPISPRCDYCTGGARDYYFSAYIRYGMIADESVNIQAGYAHKTIGFGDISVGIDVNGTPSFSASVATVVPYVARAVTVTY